MIITMIVWFILGVFVGIALGSIVISVYGDPEVNEHVRRIRQQRIEMELARRDLSKTKTLVELKNLVTRLEERASDKS